MRRHHVYKLYKDTKNRAVNILTSLVLAVTSMSGGLPLLLAQKVQAAPSTVVTPSSTQGWSRAYGVGDITYVADPTAPLGNGALKMNTPTGSDYAMYYRDATTPVLLTDSFDISFSSKRLSGDIHAAPAIVFGIDPNGDGNLADEKYAYYEPVYNDSGENYDVWNTWNINKTTSQLWAFDDFHNGKGIQNGGNFFTFDYIASEFPGAKIVDYTINQGTGAPGWSTLVDNLTTPDTTFDFETEPSELNAENFNTVNGNYKGISVGFNANNFGTVTAVTVDMTRADGSHVVKHGNQGVFDIISGATTAQQLTAPFVIQDGTFSEASDTHFWDVAPATWTVATRPVSVLITVTDENGSTVVTNSSFNDGAPSWPTYRSLLPADTTAPVMTGYQLSDYFIGRNDSNPTLTGTVSDPETYITDVKYAIWPLNNAGGRMTPIRGWTSLPAADGAYGSQAEATNSVLNGLKDFPEGRYEIGIRGYNDEGLRGGVDLIFYVDNTVSTFNATLSDDFFSANSAEPTLTGTITDTVSPIATINHAIWQRNPDGSKGTVVRNWTNLPAGDGTFDETTEELNTAPGLTGLPEGQYILGVRALDAAKNRVSGGDFIFTIDNTAPTTTITSPTAGEVLRGTTLNVEGSVTDTNPRYYYCYLTTNSAITYNSVNYTPGQEVGVRNPGCITTWSSTSKTGLLGTIDMTGLPDGDYTIHLVAYDTLGNNNAHAPTSVSFTLDNTAPVLTIDPITDSTDTTRTITGTIDDPAAAVTITVDGGSPELATNNGDGTWAYTASSLSTGPHTVTASSTDATGNTTAPEPSHTQSFNTTAPSVLGAATTGGRGGAGTGAGSAGGNENGGEQNFVAQTTTTEVLGETDADSNDGTDNKDDSQVAAATTEDGNTENNAADNGGFLGLAWYWWILILAAIGGAGWWFLASRSERD